MDASQLAMSTSAPSFRVLYVADAPARQQALRAEFAAHDIELLFASPGIDAVMQFRSQEGDFAAILTHLRRPTANGIDFIKWVRSLGYEGLVIVSFEDISHSDLWELCNLGVSGLLQSPFPNGMVTALLGAAIVRKARVRKFPAFDS
jgi:DNA-binding NtrC family response regulator